MATTRPERPLGVSLRAKLILLAVSVAAIPLTVVGWTLLDVNEEALEETNQELLFAVIDDVAATLDRSIREAEYALEGVARVLTDSELGEEARIRAAAHWVAASSAVTEVGLYDAAGSYIDGFRHPEASSQLPRSLPPDLRAASWNARFAVGRAVVVQGQARVPLVMPLLGQATTWHALSYISLQPVQGHMEALALEKLGGTTSSVFLVDTELRILAHADPEKAGTLVSAEQDEIFAGVDGKAIDKGLVLFGDYRSQGGQRVIGAVRSLSAAPWAVAAQIPRSRAYASITKMRRIVSAVVALVIAVSVLAAFVVAARITAPIKKLVVFANDLAARRFDRRISIPTRDELRILGDSLSHAAAELEASERRLGEEIAIRTDLGRYLPDQLVEQVVRREQSLRLGGERREITVLFADVAGFTPLIEKYPAEVVVTILNQLFTILTEIVFRHQGTVDKFVGDCVMAFWGAPQPQTDHAALALAAAEDMIRWLEFGNEGWREQYGITIHLAIGVNTGEAVVGNFGSETRMEYTALGDAVNLAARLEPIARPQQILLSAATKRAAGDAFEYVPLGPREFPGRSEPVELFELRV